MKNLWTFKILSITQSKKAQIISYDMIYAWLHTDFRYIVLNWPDYIWVIRLCTPGYPPDTCLNRFLSSIRQMLKQDPADPNNLKETVVNILVLNYNNYCVKFSSQVNFTTKIGPFAWTNGPISFRDLFHSPFLTHKVIEKIPS